MKKFNFTSLALLFCTVAFGQNCCVSDFCCDNAIPVTRFDEVPQSNVVGASDAYLTGYLQALIDMHYFEFTVKVVVQDHIAYLYNLPANDILADSIVCFIADVPCIDCVERVECLPISQNECQLPESSVQDACLEPCSDAPPVPDCNICYYPCAEIDGIWFPQTTVLFQPLIADPRQVTYSGALRWNDDVIGRHVGAATFGDNFPIYRWKDVLCWRGDLQIGVEAGIFAVFDLDAGENSLVNTDFFVSIPLTYAFDRWSFRFRVWHMSSHLGDEFLIINPGFNRCNVSDEGTDFYLSYQCPHIRLYGGIGYIFGRDDSFPKDPIYFEYGTELRYFGIRECYSKLYMQPFLAMHFRNWQENDFDFDATLCLGVEWSKLQGVGRKFRLFVEYHNGFSAEGQFVKERCDYIAIRTTYGF